MVSERLEHYLMPTRENELALTRSPALSGPAVQSTALIARGSDSLACLRELIVTERVRALEYEGEMDRGKWMLMPKQNTASHCRSRATKIEFVYNGTAIVVVVVAVDAVAYGFVCCT